MSENVKDKVKQVLGLMGICPDYPVRLYCSFIAPRSTAKEPVNRDFLEIPDEWVAKVADRIAELEAEIARLKSQDEWHDGIPPESGWYWVQVYGGKPEVGEFEFFDCGEAGVRWNLHLTGTEEPLRPEDGAIIKWKKIKD